MSHPFSKVTAEALSVTIEPRPCPSFCNYSAHLLMLIWPLQHNGPMLRAVLLGSLAVVLFGCAPPEDKPSVIAPSQPANLTSPATPSGVLSEAVIARCKRSVVLILNFEGGRPTAMGSGFVTDGGKRIITNKHVVTGTDDLVDDCKVIFNSGTAETAIVEAPASAIAVDPGANRNDAGYYHRDVAAITLSKSAADYLEPGHSEDLAETQSAWAIGYPHGLSILTDKDSLPSPSVHSLRVERLERTNGKVSVLQLAGPPTHGDSGGPVINERGEVVGVLESVEADSAGICYAVPTDGIALALAFKTSAPQSNLNVSHGESAAPTRIAKRSRSRWLGLSADEVTAMGHVSWMRQYARSLGASDAADLSRPDNARGDDLYVDAMRQVNRLLYRRLSKQVGVRIGRIDDALRLIDAATIEMANDSAGRPVIMQTATEEAAQAEYDMLQSALTPASAPSYPDDPDSLRAAAESLARAASSNKATVESGRKALRAVLQLRSLIPSEDRADAVIAYRFAVHALQP